jgi:putative endonuclease
MEAKELGRIGERLAVELFTELGYRVLATNYHSPYGELDVVALKDDQLVFIEVKSRSRDKNSGFSNVSVPKQKKIIKAALGYLNDNQQYNTCMMRFDVVVVFKSGKEGRDCVEHLPDAFRVNDLYAD